MPVCDVCDKSAFSEDNPFVQIRVPRPSDPSDWACILAGHFHCYRKGDPASSLPSFSEFSGGMATPAQWEAWIESPAAKRAGVLFLS